MKPTNGVNGHAKKPADSDDDPFFVSDSDDEGRKGSVEVEGVGGGVISALLLYLLSFPSSAVLYF